jgi:C-3',4' desaturase CrtD
MFMYQEVALRTPPGAPAGPPPLRDVAVVGAGMAGMATAARLQSEGLSTVVLEAHGQPGGCAGFFRRHGFSFDVGATTLVDFEPGGVGHELLAALGMPPVDGQALPGYVAWLPDRTVILHRDGAAWAAERLQAFGGDASHRAFWDLLDRLAAAFWKASRRGIRLPIGSVGDLLRAARSVDLADWPLARFSTWTMGDALRRFGLERDLPLRGLLGMLIEDTVHSTVEAAPLVNAALGVTIRGAGLTRARGGMRGFWRTFTGRYRELGGELVLGARVERIEGSDGDFLLRTRRGAFRARHVVSALPAPLTARLAPAPVADALEGHLRRNREAQGGAVVVFLGVPDHELRGQVFTHHQLLQDYSAPLGDGNNMFISASPPRETESAPDGFRAVVLSTHCELAPWEGLTEGEYEERKRAAGARLLRLARRVYPGLGERAVVLEVGTPRTYERFTSRPRGSVGGYRLGLGNSNQRAIPHDVGVPGFWLAGDTTWPGLGTVACVLGSRLIAERILSCRSRRSR